MATLAAEEEALWRAVDKDEGHTALAILADWYEERDEPKAPAIRWLLSRGWIPDQETDVWDWWYHTDLKYLGPTDPRADLPEQVFRQLKPGYSWWSRYEWRSYPSRRAAYEALVEVLVKLATGNKT